MPYGVFLPVQTVLNAVIQQMSNSTYTDGNAALSEWLQNTFGSLPTEAQIRDKYGEWADTYMELNSHSVYGRTKTTDAQRLMNVLNYVPIVGATLARFVRTGAYYDDESFLGQLAYLTSMAGKARF